MSCVIERRHRLFDKFNVYFLPAFSLFFSQFYALAFGFKVINKRYKLGIDCLTFGCIVCKN